MLYGPILARCWHKMIVSEVLNFACKMFCKWTEKCFGENHSILKQINQQLCILFTLHLLKFKLFLDLEIWASPEITYTRPNWAGILWTLSRGVLWRASRQMFSPFLFCMHLVRVIQKARSALNPKSPSFFQQFCLSSFVDRFIYAIYVRNLERHEKPT